jgi:UDP:flavonoid glycosyltransferase YjiC (YdhE family)
MGEYMRSLAIARAVCVRWPAASVHFALSREAPYAAAAPFPATLLPSSPTFHTRAVVALIEQFRPTMVLFDNAGRGAQLRAARRLGAQVIYISARRRQRRKAFRLAWLRLIDEHWIAYPAFIAGGLSLWERFKLRLAGRTTVRFLDVVLPPADASRRGALLAQLGLAPGSFVLVVPGGGTGHPGAADAAARFHAAAAALARGGTATAYVGPPGSGAAAAATPGPAQLCAIASLAQADLAELMRAARVVVANGGSTLLQSVACGAATVAVPIAGDQALRIRRAVEAGVCRRTALDADDIARSAAELLADEPARAALAARAGALGLADGITVAVDAIAQLQARSARAVGARA